MKKTMSYSVVEDFVDHVMNTKDLNKQDLIVNVFSLIKTVNDFNYLNIDGRKILEIVDSVKTTSTIDYAVSSIRKELNTSCLPFHVPMEFEKDHGIAIESNLSVLLELYHQMRVKQDANTFKIINT